MDSSLTYQLLDSGEQKKLEQIGPYQCIRPSSQAIWSIGKKKLWNQADAVFSRETDKEKWAYAKAIPSSWTIELKGIKFKIAPTDFGHIGVFPEHAQHWEWMQRASNKKPCKVLNLFAYTGGASLFLAKEGFEVCHVDASKTTVAWARENAEINGLDKKPIRWIVDDCIKFLRREVKRGNKYEGILLDPPSFGRGAEGQVFKIEDDIHELLSLCKEVLHDQPHFVLFTCHTPGFTPLVMQYLLEEYFHDLNGSITSGEMTIPCKDGHDLPSGSFARWSHGR